jgi:acetyl-CoA carboxylase biotin carboxyl carrier protein
MSTSKKTLPSPTAPRRVPTARPQEPAKPTAAGLVLGFEDIQTLISLVGREPIDEFQFESLGVKLHIRKLASGQTSAPAQPRLPARTPLAIPQTAAAQDDEEPAEDPGIHPITSPIVGTFYRAPSTNAAPFVQPGDFVKPGQTLCIVEAMKLMNEIECDVAGEVVAVLAENGQPVEYGERLFAIRVR